MGHSTQTANMQHQNLLFWIAGFCLLMSLVIASGCRSRYTPCRVIIAGAEDQPAQHAAQGTAFAAESQAPFLHQPTPRPNVEQSASKLFSLDEINGDLAIEYTPETHSGDKPNPIIKDIAGAQNRDIAKQDLKPTGKDLPINFVNDSTGTLIIAEADIQSGFDSDEDIAARMFDESNELSNDVPMVEATPLGVATRKETTREETISDEASWTLDAPATTAQPVLESPNTFSQSHPDEDIIRLIARPVLPEEANNILATQPSLAPRPRPADHPTEKSVLVESIDSPQPVFRKPATTPRSTSTISTRSSAPVTLKARFQKAQPVTDQQQPTPAEQEQVQPQGDPVPAIGPDLERMLRTPARSLETPPFRKAAESADPRFR